MRVLEVRQTLRHGNLCRLIIRTAALLARRGFRVDVLVLYNRNRARLLGADPATLPDVHPMIADAEQHGVRAWQTMDDGWLARSPVLSIWRRARSEGCDVLHTHDFKSDALGLLVGKALGIPVVASAHGYPRAIARSDIYRFLDTLVLGRCCHVVCVSDGLRRELAAAGLDERRMTVVHNGIDVDEVQRLAGSVAPTMRAELGIPAQAPCLMAVGRLSQEKGHVYLLRAAQQVMAQRPDVHVVIVGEGPLRHTLEEEARRLAIADRVAFVGFQAAAPAYMVQCDVLINPSLSEALGNVVLEAMALGKPVIGSAVGGIPEIIVDGQTGLLVPPADSGALASALLQLLADPAATQAMGQRAAARVQEAFTIERMADGLAQVFERCTAAAGA